MTATDAGSSELGPTPETILAHELVGLRVRVVEARNEDLVGVTGRVVEETTNTLRIEGEDSSEGPTDGGRIRTVPKAGATFEFELPAGEYVTVEGRRLVSRPARRTKHATGGTTWHSA